MSKKNNEEKLVVVKVRHTRTNYPKTERNSGDFAIIKAKLISIEEGELHPRALNNSKELSIKGCLPLMDNDEEWILTLSEDELNDTYGMSYQFEYAKRDFHLESKSDLKIFLSNVITELQLQAMFDTFDNPLIPLQNNDIEALTKVKGVGEKTARNILRKYNSTLDYAEAYIELDGFGLTKNAIHSLSEEFGSPNLLIDAIKEDPYVLTKIRGYGFKKADEVAIASGIEYNSTKRICAYIQFILDEMGWNGKSWISSQELMYNLEEDLEIDEGDMDLIVESINILKEVGYLWNEEKGKVASKKFYTLELKIVKELFRLISAPTPTLPNNWSDIIKKTEKLQGWDFTNEQIEAIKFLSKQNVSILLGRGGTGKTATALGVVEMNENCNFNLCCLAGKAAARLQESTGHYASTIHKLLSFQNGEFAFNKENQLPTDVVILDEYGMVGGELFYSLIKSIPSGAKLIMMGDTGQLSSIGSLNIATDLIESEVIPKIEITKIHRQAEKSAIIKVASKVYEGEQIFDKGWTGEEILGELKDVKLIAHNDDAEETALIAIEEFKQKLQQGYNIQDIQLISPQKTRGESSVYALNILAQQIYNPLEEGDKTLTLYLDKKNNKKYEFKIGDKVLNTKNNYNMKNEYDEKVSIFNGYLGTIVGFRGMDMLIDFPLVEKEGAVIVTSKHWLTQRAINLGYCVSTHKMQGSESDHVIYCLDNSHFSMLCKQQLYTGITRAKLHLTLVCNSNALYKAIETDALVDKQTFMQDMVTQANNGEIDFLTYDDDKAQREKLKISSDIEF